MSSIWWIYATNTTGYWKSLSTILKPSCLNSTKNNVPTHKITSEWWQLKQRSLFKSRYITMPSILKCTYSSWKLNVCCPMEDLILRLFE